MITEMRIDTNYKLINFNIPLYLANNLDSILGYKNISRTSLLNSMLSDWVREETDNMEKDGLLNDLVTTIQTNNKVKEEYQSTKKQYHKPDGWLQTNISWEDSY